MDITKQIKCFKYIILIYIILLALSGAAQIVIGGLLLWGHLGYSLILENKFWAPSTVQLCIGPFILIFCWLGWNATSRKNRCQLIWFSLVLIALVCVQLFICGWSLAMRDTLPTSAEFHVENSFHQFLQNHAKSNQTHTWNRIQYDLRCCGIHGSIDYRRGGSTSIPFSCCVRPENPTDQICSGLYSRGCLDILSSNARDLLLKTTLVAFCMAVAQCTGIFCVIHTITLIKKQPREELPTVTLKAKTSQELSPLASHRQSRNI